MKSVVSRIVVTGAAVCAAAGWIGAPSGLLTPQDPAQAAVIQVRDRAAWQPSPVPSQYQTQPQPLAEAPMAAPAAPVAAMPAPAVSAAPSAVPPSFLATLTGRLKGLFGGQDAPAGPGVQFDPIASPVIPMTQLFHHDALEELYAGTLPDQRGEWRHFSFYSRALGREMSYMAWLPPGYATSSASFPTLYLLHGVGSPEAFGPEEWLGYALTEDLDRMLALGLIEPMIVVLPQGDQSYWVNHAGGPKWGDYVALDLVKHIDATFRTDARRERRAVGGLSMGGHGAVQLAYNHPTVFSVAGAHSPTIRPFETSPDFFGDPAHFAKHDPISLAKSTDSVKKIVTWIDVGADDQWRSGAEALRDALAAKRAPVEFRVLEGEHEGWYWEYYLPEYLHFYSQALHASGTTPSGAPRVSAQLLTSSVSAISPANERIAASDGATGL
ncbi:MAG TPA: alpha/beta hydrolase-fold protein [Chloroflexota bacterium]|nr:alpha/beta hydrolase-fold protein [Chloroflexota bacterium]